MFPARIELATFRVLGGRDNHYTTETAVSSKGKFEKQSVSYPSDVHANSYPYRGTREGGGGGGVDGTPPRIFHMLQ